MASLSLHYLNKILVYLCVSANTISPSDETYDSINTILVKSLHCFPPLYQIASYFPRSLVALANKHLSILREVCVINDSITHHPVRSHSTHPRTRSI